MEKYAEENNVPIMDKKGLKFLVDYIKFNNVKSILEVGSAIGYSAINMALVNTNITVTTIEKDEVRYFEALKNIKRFKLDKRINLILGDALEINLEEKYDLVFIDAAKGQYIRYFEKYSPNVKEDGTIISDNIYFHGLIEQNERIEKKNLRQLVDRIKRYILFLNENQEFKTEFFKVGDGLAVSQRRKDNDENTSDAK
ncbi:MAG: O-methyltransferase [Bacilli bacterium]|nr:O-methyltransferase [Bacilli bacterium]MDD4053902.1 O-methyltransferase [Bacilli bacterium]MDD4411271.1 O-methyltransferase [Bacilli bacterium]